MRLDDKISKLADQYTEKRASEICNEVDVHGHEKYRRSLCAEQILAFKAGYEACDMKHGPFGSERLADDVFGEASEKISGDLLRDICEGLCLKCAELFKR